MRQLIISNAVNIAMKKHSKKRKRNFVNTIKESEIVLDVRVRRCVSTKEEEDRVSNVKALAITNQLNQNDHLLNDSLIMLKTGFVQW